MRKPLHPPVRRDGFTLLELVLAMGVLALLVGMIFGSATANIELSNTVVRKQNEESARNAFFTLLANRFGTLPGNTRMELTWEDAGNHYLSKLTLQNVPLAFTWGGTEKVAKAVQIATVARRDNYLDIVLRYYEYEILEDSDNVNVDENAEPFAEVVLLEDVRGFEWRVLDGRTMEWQNDWDLVGRLPLQLELTIGFGAQGKWIRQIFWITPKQDPEVMMRQLQQQQGQGGQGLPGGQPGGGIQIGDGQNPGGGPGGGIRPGGPGRGEGGGRGQGGGGGRGQGGGGGRGQGGPGGGRGGPGGGR
jgi:prepilin-type N-terminal cleavage/methylation domain-containing protein